MKNRRPKYPGRVRLSPVSGQENLYDMTMADEATEQGDPLNKATLLTDDTCRLYGFENTAVPNDIFKAIQSCVVPIIAVEVPEGASIVVTDGKMTLTNADADEVDGIWKFYVQPGTWTVTTTKGVVEMSSTVYVDEVRTYSVKLLFEKIYGAEWDGTESAVWARTDVSANFVDPSPAVGNGTGSSPFDELYPWAGMQRSTDEYGNDVVSIPKFWYKWTRNGAKMKLQIADYPANGFYISPAHSDRGDGSGERDIVYVGRYHCNASGESVTNVLPGASITASNAQNKLQAVSGEYFLIDYQTYWTICMLYLVEFADWRNQLKIGYGCSPAGGSFDKFLMGRTDAMQYHTGTDAASRTTYGSTQYRHIEDLWGNVYDWIGNAFPSLYYNSLFCARSPISFGQVQPNFDAKVPMTRGEGYIKSWSEIGGTPQYDTNIVEGMEFMLAPATLVDENSYVRDYFSTASMPNGSGGDAWGALFFGGSGLARNFNAGLFCLKGIRRFEGYSNIGYRLIRLPGYGA